MANNGDDYRHFVCIVAGDNPDELIRNYSTELKVEPYTVYRRSDAEMMKEYYEKRMEELENVPDETREYCLKMLREKSVEEFYDDLTEDYEIDPDTGDAISRENPDGRYRYCNIGRLFSIPFRLKGCDDTAFQASKDNVDWTIIHLNDSLQEKYGHVWDMVMCGAAPRNENESLMYENMRNRTEYFRKFGDRATYVASNTAFWGYAFLSKDTGWVEYNPSKDTQFEWMSGYYDRFIANLPGNTLLTIYECHK